MRFLFISLGIFLALAMPAQAKGPTSASLTGPGLESPIMVRSGPLFDDLVVHSVFPEAVMGPAPGPALDATPTSELGPRYVVTYAIEVPDDHYTIRQHVYPYARGGPVTYVPPKQPLFGRTTHGGWYRAAPELEATLEALGLPTSSIAPSGDEAGVSPNTRTVAGALAVAVVLALSAAYLARRRVRLVA